VLGGFVIAIALVAIVGPVAIMVITSFKP